jgi:mRNA-degrading endonuclease RelE of RelBE toxin-antitoxin system
MSTQDQFIQLGSLPEDVRKQVLDFIEFLMERKKRPEEPKKKRIAGLAKGMITIPDDFDEPLEDFKDYM